MSLSSNFELASLSTIALGGRRPHRGRGACSASLLHDGLHVHEWKDGLGAGVANLGLPLFGLIIKTGKPNQLEEGL